MKKLPAKPKGNPLTLATFENLGPVKPADVDRFGLVNQYHDLARLSMAQSCAYMILAGVELLALKKDAEHGTWQHLFADRTDGKSKNVFTFAFTYQTSRNYERLAGAAKKHIPELQMLSNGNVPLSLMPPEQREKIVAAIRKAGDGSTYSDLAQEWGLTKPDKKRKGGKTEKGEDTEAAKPEGWTDEDWARYVALPVEQREAMDLLRPLIDDMAEQGDPEQTAVPHLPARERKELEAAHRRLGEILSSLKK